MSLVYKMGKSKEADESILDVSGLNGNHEEIPYEDKLKFCSAIAHPMASKKTCGRVYKLIKKASKQKKYVYTGLKDVQRQLRNGDTGIIVLAGDISPIDIMCHIPALCEEKDIPYIYTPSRMDIGAALGVKRGALILLVKQHEDYSEAFSKVEQDIKKCD